MAKRRQGEATVRKWGVDGGGGVTVKELYTILQLYHKYAYRVVLAMVGGVVTATHWVCGRRRQVDLDLEGEIVQHPGEEEERDEALFNFPLGNNNDEPPPPYVRIKTFTHNSTGYVYIYVK